MTWFGWKNDSADPSTTLQHQQHSKVVNFGSAKQQVNGNVSTSSPYAAYEANMHNNNSSDHSSFDPSMLNGLSHDQIKSQIGQIESQPLSDIQKKLKSLQLSHMYHKIGNINKARMHIDMFLQAKPEYAPALRLKGLILQDQLDFVGALTALENAYKFGSKDKEIIVKICQMLIEVSKSFTISDQKINKWIEVAEMFHLSPEHIQNLQNLLSNQMSSNNSSASIHQSPARPVRSNNSFDFSTFRNLKESEKIKSLSKILKFDQQSTEKQQIVKYIEALTEIYLILRQDPNSNKDKLKKIFHKVEYQMKKSLSNPEMINDNCIAYYMLLTGSMVGVYQHESKTCQSSQKMQRLFIRFAASLISKIHCQFQELVAINLKCICDEIKIVEVSKQKFLRIDDADRNFLENFVTYLGLGSANDFTALILLQQSIILSQTMDLSSIKIHKCFDRFWLVDYAFTRFLGGIDHIFSPAFLSRLQVIPTLNNQNCVTMWDIAVFLSAMKAADDFSAVRHEAQKQWSEIVSMIDDFKQNSPSFDILKCYRYLDIDRIENFSFYHRLDDFEENLCNQLDSLSKLSNDPNFGSNLLAILAKSSNSSEYTFPMFFDKLSTIEHERSMHKSSEPNDKQTSQQGNDAVTLKLIETFGRYLNINSSTRRSTQTNDNEIEYAGLNLADIIRSDSNTQKIPQSTPAPKPTLKSAIKPSLEPIFEAKEEQSNDESDSDEPIVLHSVLCSLKLLRNPGSDFISGKLIITKQMTESECIFVEFVSLPKSITKLRFIVNFIDGIPVNPLKLRQVDQTTFEWRSVDFSPESDATSIQASQIRFSTQADHRLFITNLETAQKIECVKKVENENDSRISYENVTETIQKLIPANPSADLSASNAIPANSNPTTHEEPKPSTNKPIQHDETTQINESSLQKEIYEPTASLGPLNYGNEGDQDSALDSVEELVAQTSPNAKNTASPLNNANDSPAQIEPIVPPEPLKQQPNQTEKQPLFGGISNTFQNVSFAKTAEGEAPATPNFSSIFATNPAPSGGDKSAQDQPKTTPIFQFMKPTNNANENPKPEEKPQQSTFSLFGKPPTDNEAKTEESTKPTSLFNFSTLNTASQDEKQPDSSAANSGSLFSFVRASEPAKEATEVKTTFSFDRFSGKNASTEAKSEVSPKKVGLISEDKTIIAEEELQEQGATLLFHTKAKLFRFSVKDKEWRTRGTGTFKVLIPDEKKDQKIVQFFLRRQPLNQVSINCLFSAEHEFMPINNNSPLMTSFMVLDSSDGEPQESFFSIKFENAELCEEFKKKVTDAIQ